MKTITKLSIAAIAAVLVIPASADEVKLEVKPSQHGGVRFQYRAVEPTVAAYTGGQAVGEYRAYEERPELCLKWRDTGHGTRIPMYVAVDK